MFLEIQEKISIAQQRVLIFKEKGAQYVTPELHLKLFKE